MLIKCWIYCYHSNILIFLLILIACLFFILYINSYEYIYKQFEFNALLYARIFYCLSYILIVVFKKADNYIAYIIGSKFGENNAI